MKWLKSQGCPWDEVTYGTAIQKRNMINVQWLKDNGCPIGF